MDGNENRTMKIIDTISMAMILAGALNWGSIGWLGFNFIEAVFGAYSAASHLVYALVGVAALYRLILWTAIPRRLAGGPHPKSF